MCPKPTRWISQDCLLHHASVLLGDVELRHLFRFIGNQFYLQRVKASRLLPNITKHDRQIQLASQSLRPSQEGCILIQKMGPIMQVGFAWCLVGDEDTERTLLGATQTNHLPNHVVLSYAA